jgi:hypothetical protein
MMKKIKDIIKKTPILRRPFVEIDRLRLRENELQGKLDRLEETKDQNNGSEGSNRESVKMFVPPGHFYSPIPSIGEIKLNERRIFGTVPKALPGIDLNETEQLRLFCEFKKYYSEMPFPVEKRKNLRYFFANPNYSYSDAIFLYSMIRYTKPKKIIEVGSGYSSCVFLDTNELLFNNTISCTFIEPYPELLMSLIKDSDKNKINIIPQKLQEIQLGIFSELSAGDILFIDSTHVSKVNSDTNYVFFEILPALQKGVYIHFHDIMYPFEYPKEWIYEGRAWNEAYLLRAFLQYNDTFKIVFFNTFMEFVNESRNELVSQMPLVMKNPGGSIWLKKVT